MSTTDDQRLRDAKTRLCKYVSTRTDGRRGYDVDDIHSFDLGTEGEGSFLRLSDIKLILAAVSEPAAPVDARVAALLLAQRMCREALPKFNWGASFLDANAIQLLNEAPAAIDAALARQAAAPAEGK